MTAHRGEPASLDFVRGLPAYFAGPRSFMRAEFTNFDPRPEAAVAVLGLPFLGWRGDEDHQTAEAPAAVRAASARWVTDAAASGFAPLVQIDSGARRRFLSHRSLVDTGDVSWRESNDLDQVQAAAES